MNIKFGMDNFYVRYLKRFLNHELSNSSTVLGEFDKGDLKSLIKYFESSPKATYKIFLLTLLPTTKCFSKLPETPTFLLCPIV